MVFNGAQARFQKDTGADPAARRSCAFREPRRSVTAVPQDARRRLRGVDGVRSVAALASTTGGPGRLAYVGPCAALRELAGVTTAATATCSSPTSAARRARVRRQTWRCPGADAGPDPRGPDRLERDGVFTTPGAAAAPTPGAYVSRSCAPHPPTRTPSRAVRNAAAALDPLIARPGAARSRTDAPVRAAAPRDVGGASIVIGLIGFSLLLTALEQLRERRRLLAVLVAFGTRRSTLSWSLLWQSAVPVALGLVVALATGIGLGAILLRMIDTGDPGGLARRVRRWWRRRRGGAARHRREPARPVPHDATGGPADGVGSGASQSHHCRGEGLMKRVFLFAAHVRPVVLRGTGGRRRRRRRARPGSATGCSPSLGNGGYDVQHYDLDLRYATSAPTAPDRRHGHDPRPATQALSAASTSTSPDTAIGGVVGQRRCPRSSARDGEDLVITPTPPLAQRGAVPRHVSHFVAAPTVPNPTTPRPPRSSSTRRARRPRRSPTSRTCSCRPTTTRATRRASTSASTCPPARPRSPTASRSRSGRAAGARTSVYVQRQPMATELLQLAVGQTTTSPTWASTPASSCATSPPSHHGASIQPCSTSRRRRSTGCRRAVGAYPFDLYGSLVVDADLGFALETQTLELIDTFWFHDYAAGTWDPTLLHELSHMWFGDSVRPYSWSDLWLNEGHASWYEFLYAEEKGFLEERHRGLPGRHRLRRLRRPDEGRLRARRRVARGVRPGRAADQRGHAVRLPARRARARRRGSAGVEQRVARWWQRDRARTGRATRRRGRRRPSSAPRSRRSRCHPGSPRCRPRARRCSAA